jgi:hypothetical protein
MEQEELVSGNEDMVEIITSEASSTDADPVEDSVLESASDTFEMSVEDYGKLMVSSMPIGALTGAIFMIVGLAVLVIVKIFKKV